MAGLTSGDKDCVKATWAEVKKDVPGHSVDLFMRLFTAYPDYQKKFNKFKDVPFAELKGNKDLLDQATTVVNAMTKLVDIIDDANGFNEMVKKLGRDHYKRQVTVEHFQNFKGILMSLLKDKLGSGLMNDNAIAAWDKTYAIIVSGIKTGLEEAAKSG
jgi:hemoglobin-like flavoprotein